MTIQDAINTLQQASLQDRIHTIELLLESLKNDIAHTTTSPKIQKPFHIRTFDLGGDVIVDREEMYLGRGL